MLHERMRNRLLDVEACKLTARYGINDTDAYLIVKEIISKYEAELRKREKQLVKMSRNNV